MIEPSDCLPRRLPTKGPFVPSAPPQWRLPPGVPKGLWEYAQLPHIATDYDNYFAHNTLFEFDTAVLRKHFERPGLLVDLGCGTGRLMVPFARDGYPCLAVDLSLHMLGVVGQKTEAESLPIHLLQANMVQLDNVQTAVADYAICMFSTLGMIRGRANRQKALAHAARILKPGGLFVLHVHNRWRNLLEPQSRWWVVRNLVESRIRRDIEPGDKFFSYRGVRQMFLHVFTRHELTTDLRSAGFEIVEFLPLNTERRHALNHAWWLGRLRANGWIVVCRKP